MTVEADDFVRAAEAGHDLPVANVRSRGFTPPSKSRPQVLAAATMSLQLHMLRGEGHGI